MRFMQTESVLQTKNRSRPAKNRFSVALVCSVLSSSVIHHVWRKARYLVYLLAVYLSLHMYCVHSNVFSSYWIYQ